MTPAQLRNRFWEENPELASERTPDGRHNSYRMEIRMRWADFKDKLLRIRAIEPSLARRTNL